jgi:hypothetical protein
LTAGACAASVPPMTQDATSLSKLLTDISPRERVLLEAATACPATGAPAELLVDLYDALDEQSDEDDSEALAKELAATLAALAERGLLTRQQDDVYVADPALAQALGIQADLRTILTLYHASTTEMLLRELQEEGDEGDEDEDAEAALAPQVRHAVRRLTEDLARVDAKDRQEAAALLLELAREQDLDEAGEQDARAAETAARAVLKLTGLRERTPELWADAQMTLGFALAALPSNGANHDDASLAAFRAAAEVSEGENRAFALSCVADALALRVDGDEGANLEEALSVFQQALAELSPRQQPEAYAETQCSVGEVTRRLFELDDDADSTLLETSLAAFDAALELQGGDELRLARAISLRGRADTLRALPAVSITDRCAKLEQAITSYREALDQLEAVEAEVGERLEGDEERANYLLALGSALHELADEGERLELLSEASDRYRAALALSSAEDAPQNRAMALINLAGLLCDLHEDAPTEAIFAEAKQACEEALKLAPAELDEETWAAAHNNLAGVYLKLSDGGTEALRKARSSYDAALTVYDEDHPQYEQAFEDLVAIEEQLSDL